MPRLSLSERTRIVTLYYKHNLHFKRARYHVLRKFALEEDIISSERTIRRTIKHWLLTGSVLNKKSLTRSIRLTKITAGELSNLDQLIYRKREISAFQAKTELNLLPTSNLVFIFQ